MTAFSSEFKKRARPGVRGIKKKVAIPKRNVKTVHRGSQQMKNTPKGL
jgi:hypothetical protein